MKIKYKLIVSSLVIVAIFMIAGALINTNVAKMDSSQSNLIKAQNIDQKSMDYLDGARSIQVGVYLYVHGNKEIGKQLMNEGQEKMRTSRNSLKGMLSDPDLITALSDVERFEEKVLDASNTVIKTQDSAVDNKDALVEQNLNTLQGRVEALNLKLKDLIEGAQKNMDRAADDARASAEGAVTITYLGVIGSMLISIILSFVMASMLTNPLKVLTDTANRVSKGNINEKVSISSKDEIGDLAESFKRMINAFKIMEALSKEK